MSVFCRGCGYAFFCGDWYCDYYGFMGRHRPCHIGKGCTVRHEGALGLRSSPPITPKAAMEDRARRRAAVTNVRKSRLDQPDAMALYEQGLNDGEIARAFGMTRNAVAKWRKKRGLKANAAVGRGKG